MSLAGVKGGRYPRHPFMELTIDECEGGLGISLGDGKGSYLPLTPRTSSCSRTLKKFYVSKTKLLETINRLGKE